MNMSTRNVLIGILILFAVLLIGALIFQRAEETVRAQLLLEGPSPTSLERSDRLGGLTCFVLAARCFFGDERSCSLFKKYCQGQSVE